MNIKPIFKDGTVTALTFPLWERPMKVYEALQKIIEINGPIYHISYGENMKGEYIDLLVYCYQDLNLAKSQKKCQWNTDLPFIHVTPWTKILKTIIRQYGPILRFEIDQKKDWTIISAYMFGCPWNPMESL